MFGQSDKAQEYRPLPGKWEVAVEEIEWRDEARGRKIPARIYAPSLEAGARPFPLLVFSHGFGESMRTYAHHARHWVAHGYIVIVPNHEGSDTAALQAMRTGALRMPAPFELRPQDITFVISQAISPDPGSKLLQGRVDRSRIGVAGHSLGSTTALAMVGLTTSLPDGRRGRYWDTRVRAVIAMSPQIGSAAGQLGDEREKRLEAGIDADSWKGIGVPTMIMYGSKDRGTGPLRTNPGLRRIVYDSMKANYKHLLVIQEAEHHAFTDTPPWYEAGERDPRHYDWINQATLAFFDAYLQDNSVAREWLTGKKLQAATGGLVMQENWLDAREVKEPPPAYDFSPVDKFLQDSLARIGGGCALILIQDEHVIYRQAFGSFTPETAVPIASASKGISGCVIMALVDRGLISLDDRASKYLPSFTGKKGEITIRQMFSHTHGFPEQPHYHRDTRITMEEAVNRIAEVPLIADPGTALLYSGLGMQMAGRIAEIVTGKPWVEIFKETIGDPLEMKNTSYDAFGETKNPNVAGSIRTCIDDYGNLVWMLVNKGIFRGRRILSEEAVKQILSNQTDNVRILRHPEAPYRDIKPDYEKVRYGIGWWLEEWDEKTGEAWEASSGGAFGCQPFLDLKRNLAGVFLPFNRNFKMAPQNLGYNEAFVVYLELKKLIKSIILEKVVISAGEPGKLRKPEPGPYEVASIDLLTLRDEKRSKELQLRITYPQRGENFPVITFSHAVGGTKDQFQPLMTCWASHGYVCIQPNHADSPQVGGGRGPGALADMFNRIVDISFIIDSLEGMENLVPELRGKIDRGSIGASGSYIGGGGALRLAGMGSYAGAAIQTPSVADKRVLAVIALSPTGREGAMTEQVWATINRPMLIITGSRDPSPRTGNPPEWRTEPFQFAPPGDKYLLWVEGLNAIYGGLPGLPVLRGGTIAGESVSKDIADYVRTTTLAFWDAYLKKDREALTYLNSEELMHASRGKAKLSAK